MIHNLQRDIRAAWRLARVGLHLGTGVATVLFVYPLIANGRRRALKQRWSHQLLQMLGVGLDVRGTPAGRMRVANHVSWLDIFALNAVVPSAFVAKDDVRRWPVIGWLSQRTETLFMQRQSRRAAHAAVQALSCQLSAGTEVAAFPEGTTSTGDTVLPFHNALLEGAVRAGVPVQPVALGYFDRGGRKLSAVAAYCDDTRLIESLWRIAAADGLNVRLDFMATRSAANVDRRALARQLHADIAAVLDEVGVADQRGELPALASSPTGTGMGATGSGSCAVSASPA